MHWLFVTMVYNHLCLQPPSENDIHPILEGLMRDKDCIISCLGVKVPDMEICCLVFWVCGDNRPLWTHWCPVCCSVKAPRLFAPRGHHVDLKHRGWWALIWPPQQTQAFLCNLQTVKHNLQRWPGVEGTMLSTGRGGGGGFQSVYGERKKKPKR